MVLAGWHVVDSSLKACPEAFTHLDLDLDVS